TYVMPSDAVAFAPPLSLQVGAHGVLTLFAPGPVPLKVAIRETGGTAVPIPETIARAVFRGLFRFGLYHTPPGAMDFLKYPCTIDGRGFERATGFKPLFSLEDIFASVRH